MAWSPRWVQLEIEVCWALAEVPWVYPSAIRNPFGLKATLFSGRVIPWTWWLLILIIWGRNMGERLTINLALWRPIITCSDASSSEAARWETLWKFCFCLSPPGPAASSFCPPKSSSRSLSFWCSAECWTSARSSDEVCRIVPRFRQWRWSYQECSSPAKPQWVVHLSCQAAREAYSGTADESTPFAFSASTPDSWSSPTQIFPQEAHLAWVLFWGWSALSPPFLSAKYPNIYDIQSSDFSDESLLTICVHLIPHQILLQFVLAIHLILLIKGVIRQNMVALPTPQQYFPRNPKVNLIMPPVPTSSPQ